MLPLDPDWAPEHMPAGVYSTESEMVLLRPDRFTFRYAADPESNNQIDAYCPQLQSAKVFSIFQRNMLALVTSGGVRVMTLEHDSASGRVRCNPFPQADYAAPPGVSEIVVYNFQRLAVRIGDTVRFLDYDKKAGGWVAAQDNLFFDEEVRRAVPDLRLDLVRAAPAPVLKSTEPEPEVNRQALDRLIELMVPARYAYAEKIGDRFILVTQQTDDLLYGVCDGEGNEIIPPSFSAIEYHEDHQRFKVARGTGESMRWGYLDTKGQVVVPVIYEDLKRISNSGVEPTVIALKDGKKGYLDFRSGTFKVPPRFDDLSVSSLDVDVYGEGTLLAALGGKWAVMNTDGKMLTKFEFSRLVHERSGTIIGTIGARPVLIKVSGKELISVRDIIDTGDRPAPLREKPFAGIGTVLNFNRIDAAAVVTYILPGSPAEKAGLQVSDAILAIDGVPIKELTPDQATQAIRGKAGTRIKLLIQRGPQRRMVSVKRELIRGTVNPAVLRAADGEYDPPVGAHAPH